MEMENKLVAIKEYIEGHPSETDFEIRSVPFSLTVTEGSNGVLVKNLYVSIDPYQINRTKKYYNSSQSAIVASTRLIPGQVIDALGVGIVEASANPGFEKGDIVFGALGWSQYSFVKERSILRKIESREFPFSYHLGILGFSGLAAYAGFYIVCKPKKGEKVFVSAASGSVGNVVGQYAKLFGCYVVGCAGTKQKVDLLKEKLGFDDAFNYKEQSDLKLTLKRLKSLPFSNLT